MLTSPREQTNLLLCVSAGSLFNSSDLWELDGPWRQSGSEALLWPPAGNVLYDVPRVRSSPSATGAQRDLPSRCCGPGSTEMPLILPCSR